jgi:hypothetical protein
MEEVMYVMLGDEADAEQGKGKKFFVYGAITFLTRTLRR